MKKVAVIGSGAFGTALAKVLADPGRDVALWCRNGERAALINKEGRNSQYLPDSALPNCLRATDDLQAATKDAEMIVLVVPSHATRDVLTRLAPILPANSLLCCATKGIENGSLMLMSEVLDDVLGDAHRHTYLSGPSFAKELAAGVPTAVTVAGNEVDAQAVQGAFAGPTLRVYDTQDIVGVEVGGALKNVVAIAAGAIDGLGFGLNTRAALMTRGLAEIGRLASAKGGDPMTMAGLAGMGDLVLTCTGTLSRNRTVGFNLGKGKNLEQILEDLGQVAEGVRTTKSAHELGKKLGVELPITNQVYQVIYENKPAKAALVELMTRPLKNELR